MTFFANESESLNSWESFLFGLPCISSIFFLCRFGLQVVGLPVSAAERFRRSVNASFVHAGPGMVHVNAVFQFLLRYFFLLFFLYLKLFCFVFLLTTIAV